MFFLNEPRKKTIFYFPWNPGYLIRITIITPTLRGSITPSIPSTTVWALFSLLKWLLLKNSTPWHACFEGWFLLRRIFLAKNALFLFKGCLLQRSFLSSPKNPHQISCSFFTTSWDSWWGCWVFILQTLRWLGWPSVCVVFFEKLRSNLDTSRTIFYCTSKWKLKIHTKLNQQKGCRLCLQGKITYPTWGSSENHRLKSACWDGIWDPGTVPRRVLLDLHLLTWCLVAQVGSGLDVL